MSNRQVLIFNVDLTTLTNESAASSILASQTVFEANVTLAGPPGEQGPPGADLSSTDQLPEGTANKYYTDARVAGSPTVASINTSLALKATDSAVLHLAGTETISGVKTFNTAPVVPNSAFPQAAISNLVSDLAGKETLASKGIANGYTPLDSTAKVPASYLPSATGSAQGVLRLTGDLGGTAATPLVKRPYRFIVAAHGETAPADYTCANSTGNEAEINQAIAAASLLPNGATVWLKGDFVVSGDGVLPMSRVTLTSDGSATIKHDSSSGTLPAIGSKPVIKNGMTDITDFYVEDITILGDTTNASTSCAIYLDGDNDPDAPAGAPVITNFAMRNVIIRNCSSLPVRLFGLRGKLQTVNCEFTNNLDAGYGWNEEVIFIGNHSKDSHDNGWSISRGNRKVVCVGNTSENATFWGAWLSGFGNEDGPQYLVCNSNVIINPGLSGIALINSPRNYSCVGNVIDQKWRRPSSNSDCDCIQVRGSTVNNRATDGIVANNICLNGARAGVSYGWVDRLSILGNIITNPGTQYKADGSTPISSTDISTNVGILNLHVSACSGVYIDGNNISDNRAVPFMNYGMYKVGTSGVIYGNNTVSAARNSLNQLSIPQYVAAGSPFQISAAGPDANINTWFTNKGSGRLIVRGQGSPIELQNASGSTNSAISMLMSTGNVGSFIAGVTATRTDPFQNSRLAFRLLSNGVLGSSDNAALLYLQGLSGHTRGFLGINAGVQFSRTPVNDASYAILAQDYIVAYTALTSGHTATLPSAVQSAGQTFIVKDETGTASANNITVSPFALGSPACTNSNVDPSSDIFHLSSNIVTGTPVTLSTAGTLPSPLAPATTYYVTRNILTLLSSLNEPGTLTNDNSSGFVSWQNPSNAATADGVFATWTSDGNIDPSNPRGDTQIFSGSITASSATLTSSTAIFQLTDEGKYARIAGAGVAGADLIASIADYVSPTQVTLAISAATTVSGTAAAFGSADLVTSNYLEATNFGFSIPSSAQIQGVVVKVKGKGTTVVGNQNLVYDLTAQLIKSGIVQGNNNAAGAQFTSSNSTLTYGASSDMWGLNLTPSDVNSSSFGFAIQVTSILGTMNVDDINVTIYYVTPNDIQLATSLSNALAGNQIDLTDSGSGTFTFAAPAQTIDGTTSKVINVNYGAMALYSDGSNWHVQGGTYNTSQASPIGGAGGDLGGSYPNPTVTATHLSSALPVAQGGTGSTSQNFVDLSTSQTIAGTKTFSGEVVVPVPVNPTDAATKSYVDSATGSASIKSFATCASDFLANVTTPPWIATAISSGTISAGTGMPAHPGIAHLASSTSTNSGFRLQTNTTAMALGGGESTDIIFNVPSTTNTTNYLGFHNATTSSAPTDGVYVTTSGTTLQGNTAASSSVSTTGTTYTITAGTWYHLNISVNAAANLITYTLYDMTETQLWQATLSTNIPGTSRTMGHGSCSTNSGTSATAVLEIDYMNLQISRTLSR